MKASGNQRSAHAVKPIATVPIRLPVSLLCWGRRYVGRCPRPLWTLPRGARLQLVGSSELPAGYPPSHFRHARNAPCPPAGPNALNSAPSDAVLSWRGAGERGGRLSHAASFHSAFSRLRHQLAVAHVRRTAPDTGASRCRAGLIRAPQCDQR